MIAVVRGPHKRVRLSLLELLPCLVVRLCGREPPSEVLNPDQLGEVEPCPRVGVGPRSTRDDRSDLPDLVRVIEGGSDGPKVGEPVQR